MMPVVEDGERAITLADGKPYVLAPLTLRGVKQAKRLLSEMDGEDGDDAALQLVALSLTRRHPDLSVDAISDLVTVPKLATIIRTILEISGLVLSGEAPAGQT